MLGSRASGTKTNLLGVGGRGICTSEQNFLEEEQLNYKLNPVSSSCCSQGEADLYIVITSGGVIPVQDIWPTPFGKGSSKCESKC